MSGAYRAEVIDAPAGMELRQTRDFDLAELKQDLLHPELITITVKTSDHDRHIRPLDIGALCYGRREQTVAGNYQPTKLRACRPSFTDPASCIPSRRRFLNNLLAFLYVKNYVPVTLQRFYIQLNRIMAWLDMNGHQDAFVGLGNAKAAYQAYTQHLDQRIRVQTNLKPRTAVISMTCFNQVLSAHFGEKAFEITRNRNPFKKQIVGNAAPEETVIKMYLDVWLNLAYQVTDFLVKEQPFPFQVHFREYSTWVFPDRHTRAVKTPYFESARAAYDFEAGEMITSASALSARRPEFSGVAIHNHLQDTRKSLEVANANARSYARMSFCRLALNAFACIFQLITGANSSQFVKLKHEDALKIVTSTMDRDFRAIKARAGGKRILFPIGGKHGNKILKKYLQLRKWALNEQEHELLFLSFDHRKNFSPAPLSKGFVGLFNRNNLRGVYLPADTPHVTSRTLRRYKSISLHNLKLSPKLVAVSLGHREQTNQRHYATPSESQQRDETVAYWKAARQLAKSQIRTESQKVDEPTSTTVAIGHCTSLGAAASEVESPPIPVSCATQYGCLYCKHYVCHADEKDLRKLLSLMYVLEEMRKLAGKGEHVRGLFIDLTARIRLILSETSKLSHHSSELVKKMTHEVNELGLLDPFWEDELSFHEQTVAFSVR